MAGVRYFVVTRIVVAFHAVGSPNMRGDSGIRNLA
jgi:hypothetical protein